MPTPFKCTVDPGLTGDYPSLSAAETDIDVDLTAANTVMIPYLLKLGTVPVGSTLTGSSSGFTGVLVAVSTVNEQLLMTDLTGSFAANEDLELSAGNYYRTKNPTGQDNPSIEISCICTNGAADTTALTISGATTDADNNIVITVPTAYRHNGTFPTSGNKYRLSVAGATAITYATSFVSYVGLAVGGIASANGQYMVVRSGVPSATLFDSCCLRFSNGSYTGCACVGATAGAGSYFNMVNCVSRLTGNVAACIAFETSGSNLGTITFSNCTGISYTPFNVNAATGVSVVKNCIGWSGGLSSYIGTYDAASTNNGYNLNGGPSGGSATVNLGTDPTKVFKDYQNNDFHLCAGSKAAHAGADLSGDTPPVTTDIDGQLRHAVPDIGADEFYPSGGGAVVWIGRVREKMTKKVRRAVFWARR